LFKEKKFHRQYKILFSLILGWAIVYAQISSVTAFENSKNKMSTIITGGDSALKHSYVVDIRYGRQPGFDRYVIDLATDESKRPPFYHAFRNSKTNQIKITVLGEIQPELNHPKIRRALSRSRWVDQIDVGAHSSKEYWTLDFQVQPGLVVDIFELSSPPRIVIDLKK
jgi:hypothetical protein